jgi:cell division septation protein DedD
MATATSQDTEITLGTGKMLALFFGLVALCAIFFGMGFSLGRTSVRIASPDLPAATTVTTSGARPSAVKTASANPPADMTFYKTVASKDGNSQPSAKDAPPPASETVAPAASADNSPDPATPPPANSYFVQVAAVSKAEDAAALVDALKKKQYPAFATNAPTDKLIHVQVGPYPDIKDAELMCGKLVSDGYNPILKR